MNGVAWPFLNGGLVGKRLGDVRVSGKFAAKTSLTSLTQTAGTVLVDSSGNIIRTVGNNTNGAGYAGVIKVDKDGGVLWGKKLAWNTYGCWQVYNGYNYGAAIDASDNIYVRRYTGYNQIQQGPIFDKINSAGTVQWRSTYYPATAHATDGSAQYYVFPAASGNVYTCGYFYDGIRMCGLVTKFNSSGVPQWSRKYYDLNGTRVDSAFYAPWVDADENVWAMGYTDNNVPLLVKYNSAGAIQFQKKHSGGALSCASVYVDGTGIYYASRQDFRKASLDGTSQILGRVMSDTNWYIHSLTMGDDGYFYAVLNYSNSRKLGIMKFNTSGVTQWFLQVTYSANTGLDMGSTSIAVKNGLVYVSVWVNTVTEAWVFKLGTDGSVSGTYGNWTFSSAADALTASGATITISDADKTDASETMNQHALTNNDSSETPTVALTTIQSGSVGGIQAIGPCSLYSPT